MFAELARVHRGDPQFTAGSVVSVHSVFSERRRPNAGRTDTGSPAPARFAFPYIYLPTRSITTPCDGTVTTYSGPRTSTFVCVHRSRTVALRGSILRSAQRMITVAGPAPRLNAATALAPPASGRVQSSCSPFDEAQARVPCFPSGS